MASFRINGFEGAEKMFDELYNSKKLGVKALEAAAPILVKETRNFPDGSAGRQGGRWYRVGAACGV